jgi:hypothetical protein
MLFPEPRGDFNLEAKTQARTWFLMIKPCALNTRMLVGVSMSLSCHLLMLHDSRTRYSPSHDSSRRGRNQHGLHFAVLDIMGAKLGDLTVLKDNERKDRYTAPRQHSHASFVRLVLERFFRCRHGRGGGRANPLRVRPQGHNDHTDIVARIQVIDAVTEQLVCHL